MGLFSSDSDDATTGVEPQGEYVTEKRVAKVADILDDGEPVHYLTRGSTVDVEGSSAGKSLFGNDRSRKTGTKGYVRAAFTDSRVVVKVPQILGTDERSVPYASITSVDLDTGFVNNRISLQTPGQTYHIEVHEPGKDEIHEIMRFVRDQISSLNGSSEASTSDPLDRLKKLRELHEDGVVTDEEFAEKKQSLLDQV